MFLSWFHTSHFLISNHKNKPWPIFFFCCKGILYSMRTVYLQPKYCVIVFVFNALPKQTKALNALFSNITHCLVLSNLSLSHSRSETHMLTHTCLFVESWPAQKPDRGWLNTADVKLPIPHLGQFPCLLLAVTGYLKRVNTSIQSLFCTNTNIQSMHTALSLF